MSHDYFYDVNHVTISIIHVNIEIYYTISISHLVITEKGTLTHISKIVGLSDLCFGVADQISTQYKVKQE